MGASQRRKGAAGEREWCDFMRRIGYSANRVLGQARDGGGDVVVGPCLYEVKRYHKIAVRKWLDQAAASAAKEQAVPVVAMREDGRTDWMVLLPAKDFFDILEGKYADY